MAAVPSRGRASSTPYVAPPEAEATRALYERYANQILGFCLHQLGSREEAEDAVQSTFLNAFRGLRRGVVPEQESAWLFKIAHNVCLSRRRSTWRRGRIESPADFELVEGLTPAPSRRADELIGLQDVLEGMPETQRRAILLREWQGLSYREISDELELSQSAVETLIFRARRALAQGLEQAPVQQRGWRTRVRASTNVGGLFTAIKSLLAGAATVKVAGIATVIAVSSVAATTPFPRPFHHPRPAQARVAAASKPAAAAAAVAAVPIASTPARPAAPAPRPPDERRPSRPVSVPAARTATTSPVRQPEAPVPTAPAESAAPPEAGPSSVPKEKPKSPGPPSSAGRGASADDASAPHGRGRSKHEEGKGRDKPSKRDRGAALPPVVASLPADPSSQAAPAAPPASSKHKGSSGAGETEQASPPTNESAAPTSQESSTPVEPDQGKHDGDQEADGGDGHGRGGG